MSDTARFMRGGCFALALFLHARTGWALHGLTDEQGRVHHAFVIDQNRVAYDGRGAVDLKAVGTFKGRRCAGTVLTPLDVQEVEAYARNAEPISEAKIRRFVQAHPGLHEVWKAASRKL